MDPRRWTTDECEVPYAVRVERALPPAALSNHPYPSTWFSFGATRFVIPSIARNLLFQKRMPSLAALRFCHAERRDERRVAPLIPQSKHPYPHNVVLLRRHEVCHSQHREESAFPETDAFARCPWFLSC